MDCFHSRLAASTECGERSLRIARCKAYSSDPATRVLRELLVLLRIQTGNSRAYFLSRSNLPGDVFYDIGAFRGVYGAAAKAALGDSVEVHLFEPIKGNLQAIETISKLNQFTRFEIVPSAVGFGSAVKGVFNDKDRMFRDGDASDAASTIELAATSLDAYAENSKRPPSIIKLDVDGFELQVLMVQTLVSHAIPASALDRASSKFPIRPRSELGRGNRNPESDTKP